MERVGSRDSRKIIAYVKDALREVQHLIPEKTTHAKYNVVADQKTYALPANMISLLGVYRKYDDDGKYIRIGHIQHKTLIDDLAEEEIIVL
jgi:hypothetical protein